MLVLDAVTFRHSGSDLPYRFDLTMEAGTIVGLSGASGAGKSTLLDLIAGFLSPRSGAITLDGRSLLGLPPEIRPVSILFQTDNLFNHLSVGENVALGVPRPAATRPGIAAALAQMELAGMAPRSAATLSGGQRQRVALARILLRDKPILLLDEPFTGLDAATIIPIRRMLADLVQRHGWHAILVSHDDGDLAALAKTHYRLANGTLHQIG